MLPRTLKMVEPWENSTDRRSGQVDLHGDRCAILALVRSSIASDSREREFLAAHVIAEIELQLLGKDALDEGREPLASELRWITRAFAEFAGHEVREVLEIGCGLGGLLIPLLRRGLWVTGFDLEPDAVEFCRRRLAHHNLSTRVMHGDLRTLAVDADYDALVLMRGLVSLLEAEGEQLDALRRARRALRPGGVLILDHRNLLALWPVFGRKLVRTGTLHDGRKFELGRQASVASFEGRVYERRWARFEVGEGESRVFVQHDNLRITTVSETVALLRHAGFEVLRTEPHPLVDGPWSEVAQFGGGDVDPAFVWIVAKRPG
jgi:SAM-dependent methyltransferase